MPAVRSGPCEVGVVSAVLQDEPRWPIRDHTTALDRCLELRKGTQELRDSMLPGQLEYVALDYAIEMLDEAARGFRGRGR